MTKQLNLKPWVRWLFSGALTSIILLATARYLVSPPPPWQSPFAIEDWPHTIANLAAGLFIVGLVYAYAVVAIGKKSEEAEENLGMGYILGWVAWIAVHVFIGLVLRA